ncbi:hypothetical protein [Cohnella abietis]|uniref:Uncharacterized protein n=1 Tax=Cohnella abietis TaxID=2507935 RepID=A0A3T1D300_9BACL|nr:hypothetical protein [Cohnella abietis]BBI32464.1 hypothetical protein KCTCHS21_18630 [Cohnella abietis]
MIKLIEVSGEDRKFKTPIWIPADVVVRDNGGGTAQLKITNIPGWITVAESPEEVTRKILEFKLAMVRYEASSYAAYEHIATEELVHPYAPPLDQVLILKGLAGLEG